MQNDFIITLAWPEGLVAAAGAWYDSLLAKNGKYRVLISSNVTARGIDIQQVNIVINYDIPKCIHAYLHRIGRSGSWGRKGTAINFVTKYDIKNMKTIEQYYQTEIKELPLEFVNS